MNHCKAVVAKQRVAIRRQEVAVFAYVSSVGARVSASASLTAKTSGTVSIAQTNIESA